MLPRRSWPVAGEPPTIHPHCGLIHQLQYGPAPTRRRVRASQKQQQGRRNARHKQERNKSAGSADGGGGLAGRGAAATGAVALAERRDAEEGAKGRHAQGTLDIDLVQFLLVAWV